MAAEQPFTEGDLAATLAAADGPYAATVQLMGAAGLSDAATTPLDDPDRRPRIEALRGAAAECFENAQSWDQAAVAISGLSMQKLEASDASYAIAFGLDDAAHTLFSAEWLRGRGQPFEVRPGDRYPVQDMALADIGRYSSRRVNLGMRPHDLPHVRQRPPGPERVVMDPRHRDIVDGLLDGSEIRVAVLLPNVDWDDFGDTSFPVAAIDAIGQGNRVVAAVRRAIAEGCRVIVAPECAVPSDCIAQLCAEIAESRPAPLIFAGSAHVVSDGTRANLAPILLGGLHEPAWTHRKMSRFESTRDGTTSLEDIQLENPPTFRVVTGAHVRIAAMICKDVLAIDRARLAGDLGVHLLGVPAMSATIDEFVSPAHELISRSQGVMVVANNPHHWDDLPVTHGLMSRPVRDHALRVVTTSVPSPPGLAVGALQTGWDDFIAVSN